MMAFNKLNNLESLEEQIFAFKPSLKTKEQKENVRKRLRHQLVDTKAIVRMKRMDAECESLMISLKQRLQVLQDILMPKEKKEQAIVVQQQLESNKEEIVKINLSSDSSDEETLSSLLANRREAARSKSQLHKKARTSIDNQQADLSENTDSELPLALRRKPRERKMSYKSLSSSVSTAHSKHQRNRVQSKEDHSVTTSGVAYHSEELLMEEEEEMNATPTLHIKIPSLHRGNVHYIILDSVNFARKVFDHRANEVKLQQQQHQQHSSITHSTKISKTRKKQIKTITTTTADHPVLQQLSQQEHELQLSQLIQDVMAEACTDETLQATNALANINNNLIDNYESIAQENFITYSQSSQEISYSQNSNTIETTGLQKKQRKNKRTNEPSQGQQLNEQPPRKKGRKPKKKNDVNVLEVQPPTKSNLAKYVECFSNDCELMPGSTTPAASSTRSLPLVSSTTQHFEVIDQLPQHQEQQTTPPQQQQPITYYIDGDWANGGPCQLVATSGMSMDARQLNQDDMNAPFQDFVNYIDNNGDSGNNVIARVLEANHSLPISIPLPIANLGIQNKTLPTNPQTRQQIIQNSVPVINIQIPSLPNNITSPTAAPPPAHTHKDVLDLSIKSNSNFNINTNQVLNLHKSNNTQNSAALMGVQENDYNEDCMPLDLSTKGCNGRTTNTANVTIDNQDEEFIRRLIEQSELEYTNEALKKSNNARNDLMYDHNNEKSFKAALDMPLLDFDANDLAVLVENDTTETNKQLESGKDTSNEDSNYVSMTADNTALHFADQTTSEIFNKLLDICPDNQFLDINHEFATNDDLNESMFNQCSVKNSTMCEINQTTTKKLEEKEICDTTSEDKEKTNKEHDSRNETSISTSLKGQINSSNNMSVISEDSLNRNSLINGEKSNDRMENFEKSDTPKLKEEEVIQINEKNSKTDKSGEIVNIRKSKTNSNDNTSQGDILESSKGLKKTDQQNGDKQTNEPEDTQDLEMNNNAKTLDTEDKIRSNKPNIQTSCSGNNSVKDDDSVRDDDKLKELKVNELKDTKIKENDGKVNERKVTDLKDSKNDKSANTPMKSKAKDNVVFSVKKITLTEDESIFITDSDASSGKSLDINDDKPKEKDNDETISKVKNQNNELKGNENADTSSNSARKNDVMEKGVMETENDGKKVNEIPQKSCELNEHNDKPIATTEIVNLKTPTNDNENSCETNEDDDILILKESESFCSEIINLSLTSKLENNSENSTQDLLICNLDNEDSNAEIQTHESKITSEIDLNCTNDQLPKNVENKPLNSNDDLNITSQNLTLLELESKLEGSLDFEEDYDDTLSLATSCFNSPNDERFEDSIVINDTTTTTTTDTTTKPIETKNNINDNEQSTTTTTNKDLKHFKIPKITQLTNKDNKNANTITKENESSNNKETLTPTTSLAKIVTVPINLEKSATVPTTTVLPINLEKIIRTVKNDLVVETIPTTLDVVASIPELQHEVPMAAKIIQQVFGITCLPFLVNRCFAITHCQLSHQFHDTDTVYQHLNTLDKTNVNVIYQILYNHTKLFQLYFKVFCSYYTTKNDRVKLLNMVNDCERYPEYGGEFLIAIYESLVSCGLNRVNACRLILKRIRETTVAHGIIEALVAIIMKSDWTMFTDFIEKYTQEVYKFNYRINVLEQMAPAVLSSKGPHLKQIFGKCVQTLHCDDTGLLLNSPQLIQCVALLTTNT